MYNLQVKKAVEDLIEQHQTVPGNILRALSERVVGKEKDQ